MLEHKEEGARTAAASPDARNPRQMVVHTSWLRIRTSELLLGAPAFRHPGSLGLGVNHWQARQARSPGRADDHEALRERRERGTASQQSAAGALYLCATCDMYPEDFSAMCREIQRPIRASGARGGRIHPMPSGQARGLRHEGGHEVHVDTPWKHTARY